MKINVGCKDYKVVQTYVLGLVLLVLSLLVVPLKRKKVRASLIDVVLQQLQRTTHVVRLLRGLSTSVHNF